MFGRFKSVMFHSLFMPNYEMKENPMKILLEYVGNLLRYVELEINEMENEISEVNYLLKKVVIPDHLKHFMKG